VVEPGWLEPRPVRPSAPLAARLGATSLSFRDHLSSGPCTPSVGVIWLLVGNSAAPCRRLLRRKEASCT
jgi:hypothetical protein